MYIPYKKFILTTPLSSSDVISKFSQSIQKPKFSFFEYQNSIPPLIGKINGNTFSVYRAIQYRNSFLPQVKGAIYEENDGTKVQIKMMLHPFVIAFMCVWMGGLAFIEVVMLLTAIFSPESWSVNPFPTTLAPFGMMLFGYFLMTVPFQIEAKKAEEILNKIITQPDPRPYLDNARFEGNV